jgi:hypothetical protein
MDIGKKSSVCKKMKWIVLSSAVWGLLAHGMALFNKYSYHDDASLFLIGETYALGRWMLGFLGEWMKRITGSTYYSTPLFKGVVTIFCIALIVFCVSDLLEIENMLLNIGLTGIFIAFPVITGMLGYGFTAPYYLFGTLMGVYGGYLLCRHRRWYFYIFGILLMACSVGVYQANIPVCISLLLIYLIKNVAESEESDWKKYICRLIYFAGACIGFVLVYIMINQIVLSYKKIELLDYQGIQSYGQTSVRGYLDRIVLAYREFLRPTDKVWRNMFPFSLDRFYQMGVVAGAVLTICLMTERFRKGISCGIQLMFLVFFVPLAGNFIYVISEVEQIHSLMMYGQVFLFAYFVWITDFVKWPIQKARRQFLNCVAVLLLVMSLLYSRFDNICYLKAEYLQSQIKSYFTTLVTQIKSSGGYTDETPVVYINGTKKSDATLPVIPQFKELYIYPYQFSSLINNYNWRMTMKMWCGFDPIVLKASDYEWMPEVLQMPNYPDEGSIKMIDGVIIVKFADN